MAAANATITIVTDRGTIRKTIPVIQYSVGFTTTMNQATVRDQQHSYPVQVRENDLQFSIQCRSVDEFEELVEQFREAQKAAYNDIRKGTVRLSYPAVGIDYTGYPTMIGAGVRRFEIAPVLPVGLTLVKDNINTQTEEYSTLTGKWQNIYGESTIDLYNSNIVERLYKDIFNDNPPAAGGGGRPQQVR